MLRLPPHFPLHDAQQLPQPHHPYLHHVSASDHLLKLPQVPIKPVYLLVLLVQHHYVLGQVGHKDLDGEGDHVHQGGRNLTLDRYEHCLIVSPT